MINNNRIVLFIVVIAIFIMIFIPAFIKVQEKYTTKKYKVVASKIEERAKKCIIDKKCKGSKIYLKDLYQNNYLKVQVNPKTGEYFDQDNTYVFQKDNHYQLIIG